MKVSIFIVHRKDIVETQDHFCNLGQILFYEEWRSCFPSI